MIVRVKARNNFKKEREYIVKVIFNEFLGIDYEIFFVDDQDLDQWMICLPNERTVMVKDSFFSLHDDTIGFYDKKCFPSGIRKIPAGYMNDQDFIVIYGDDTNIEAKESSVRIPIDIFASSFFMLTRWDEFVEPRLDHHGRFIGKESIAYRNGFLERPIVNEYVELLWFYIHSLDDSVIRKKNDFTITVSCDIDEPFDITVEKPFILVKASIKDIIYGGHLLLSLKRILNLLVHRTGILKFDPCYTFPWYIRLLNEIGLKGLFFIIPDSMDENNGSYELEDPRIKNIVRLITGEGHEIGMHGTYQSYNDYSIMLRNKEELEAFLVKHCLGTGLVKNRQHYLRWDSSKTPGLLDKAGYEYDYSGAYADVAGFRYGTCYSFSMWDLQKREPLRIKQVPLTIMEGTIIDSQYMNLGTGKNALKKIIQLKNIVKKYNGVFSILWHNSQLSTWDQRRLFKNSIIDR